MLRIESVKKEDKGMYQCFVRNDQESAQATAELKLGGRCELYRITRLFSLSQNIFQLVNPEIFYNFSFLLSIINLNRKHTFLRTSS